jgi:hypothetical protein
MHMSHANDARAQAEAACMEHKILDHVKQALRVTLDWKVPSIGLPRKVSSVQFTMKSFGRHLKRMMDLEERNGYMDEVRELKPNLENRVLRLQREHDEIRRRLSELAPEVEAMPALPEDQFAYVCTQIVDLLDFVDHHDVAEIELLQDSLLCDEGGEG